jgi:hypothetical protein
MNRCTLGRPCRRTASLLGVAALGVAALAPSAAAELIYGSTWDNFLIRWDSSNPSAILSGTAITGLANNESIVGLDFRAATGDLYGLGSQGMLYRISPITGQASQAIAGGTPMTLMGSAFGFDIHPINDTIRVVSNADQNLLIMPGSGSSTEQGTLRYPSGDQGFTFDPNVVHLAYGGTPMGLYGIDAGRDTLVRLNDPASGVLQTIASISLDVTELGGFDFSPATGTAYAAMLTANQSQTRFVTINLSTGAGTTVMAVRMFPPPMIPWSETAPVERLMVTNRVCDWLAVSIAA